MKFIIIITITKFITINPIIIIITTTTTSSTTIILIIVIIITTTTTTTIIAMNLAGSNLKIFPIYLLRILIPVKKIAI
jgi:hypothetical protein